MNQYLMIHPPLNDWDESFKLLFEGLLYRSKM